MRSKKIPISMNEIYKQKTTSKSSSDIVTNNVVDIELNQSQLSVKLTESSNVIYQDTGVLQINIDDNFIIVRNKSLSFNPSYLTNQSLHWTASQTFGQQIVIQNPKSTITGLPTPVDPNDVATKAYVDNNGGNAILTTTNTWNGNNTFNKNVTLNYAPDNPNDAATKAYVDNNSGNSLLTDNNNWLGTNTFNKAVALNYTPVNLSDAANKSYVDQNGGNSILPANNTWTGNNIFSKALSVPDLTVPSTYSPVSGDTSTSLKTILSNMTNGSKYDFIITGQNTPTFTVGEEHLSVTTDVGEDSSNYTYQEQISVNDIVTTLQLQINELTARVNNLENK